MDICATFGDSRINGGQIILLFGLPDPFYALCSRTETVSDDISCKFVGPIVHDKPVKFRDPRFLSGEISPKPPMAGGIFNSLLNYDN